ncbi:restriction endonuclease [Xanthomonas euvesicatoria pv. euvesicatoria]|uniref:BsuBI/PstI family type II restriction endonuclease n=6 Tax=Xanthomonas TaxID=338 RepID=Q2Q0I6_XANEU|nr:MULTISPECIES: BsuBI/PstI family type II restriction endonuclease [Xanthomonas]MBV6796057.1 restriction endonuclease [Xanthomonas campestris pv. daturae]MBV6868046.1 restriction endonuclease [Xanthomonas campestris pv. coriandri]MBV6872163.1 restriction endonuclease [Xanthomonas campestris pv. veroniae]ABB80538.1 XveI restriction endonuclease [Xanthomonas euvesicatoria]MCC8501186.1 restriction endonuclease [Xanthomonas euvesicatoria pv. euvesicatoria]
MSLPPYVDRLTIHQRLPLIFQEGTPNRNYCIREMAASAVFVMLYIGAVEGTDRWLAPKHVMRMTVEQALLSDDAVREAYGFGAMKPGFRVAGQRWYEENSREPLRDETLRQGFITNNAVVERAGLPTTSGHPRYALKTDFAALFDPALAGDDLAASITAWQEAHLSASAMARVALVRRGAVTTGEDVIVTFPNRETRRMAPGPSSVISKGVIEEFAARFLTQPAVLWVSESGAKVVARDDELAKSLNLKITADRNLPDIILVDLGGGGAPGFLLVFIEVVATDGPITMQRQEAFMQIAADAGFKPDTVAFVTAYLDRSNAAFKKTIAELAWRSFAWFASEPEHIIALHNGATSPLPLGTLMHGV